MHEQARPDRDDYVVIHWNNIQSQYWSQFFKMTPDFWQNTTEPYDFKSAMHYEAWAFLNEEGKFLINFVESNFPQFFDRIFELIFLLFDKT